MPLKDTEGFCDGEFYGLRGDFGRNRERWPEEIKIEMTGRKEIIATYSTDTKEWKASQMKYGKLEGELGTNIGLRIGFEGLGGFGK